jgi:hypothetical protein
MNIIYTFHSIKKGESGSRIDLETQDFNGLYGKINISVGEEFTSIEFMELRNAVYAIEKILLQG